MAEHTFRPARRDCTAQLRGKVLICFD